MSTEETLVVLITVPRDEAARLAKTLVEERLAACANVLPSIQSFFHWEGRLQEEDESLLLVKTERHRYAALETRVRALHSYTIPEILAVPIERGLPAYVNWVHQHVQPEGG
jgi:periplasmic divalent cation tolerance protein